MDPLRRLKKIDTTFISLVEKGANGKIILYKSADHKAAPAIEKIIKISKTDEEKHLVYGIVYSPEQVDCQGDIASAEVIEETAHSFLIKTRTNNVDTAHDEVPDEGSVVESYITKTGDPTFPLEPAGSWAVVIKVKNDATWELVKKGEITGLSLMGDAVVEPIAKSEEPKTIFGRLKKYWETKVKKDFNAELMERTIFNYLYALEDSIRDILNDDAVADKAVAIKESITQFVTAIGGVSISKAGKTLSAASLTKLASCKDMISKAMGIMDELTNEPDPVQKSKNNNGEDMKPEEIAALIEKSLKPLTDQIAKLENSNKELSENITKADTGLLARVEKIEKSSPGSQQEIKKEEKKAGIWL